MLREKLVFESVLGIDLKSFSFHNPSGTTAKFKDISYAGLINAYASELFDRFKYCSDSNGYWRFTPLEEFIQQNHPKVYVLTHPGWWQDEPLSPRERIVRIIKSRADETLLRYDKLIEKHGRKNIRE